MSKKTAAATASRVKGSPANPHRPDMDDTLDILKDGHNLLWVIESREKGEKIWEWEGAETADKKARAAYKRSRKDHDDISRQRREDKWMRNNRDTFPRLIFTPTPTSTSDDFAAARTRLAEMENKVKGLAESKTPKFTVPKPGDDDYVEVRLRMIEMVIASTTVVSS